MTAAGARGAPAADLHGKAVIVTGAGGGLGRAFAHGFAAAGARVLAADLDCDAAAETAAAVSEAGGSALPVQTDVADEESTQTMAAAAIAAFGAIDVLVNNAGVYAGLERRPFDEIDVADWDRVMACTGALRASRGAIVNIASATVLSGSPLWAHYVASKGALVALSRVMARELGDDGVRVNTLAPGFTLTDASRTMIADAESYGVARGAIKRPLQPDDIVGGAVFLASDAAAMITGQTLVVDGGRQFL
jgi:NAD(P)-dependent dehydrogenase (short-subunit alcohol dehydrogenase family)